MIDLQDLRARPEAYKKAAKDKNIDMDIDAFLNLDDERKALLPSVEEMRSKQNEANKLIVKLEGEEKAKKLEELKTKSSKLKAQEEKLKEIEEPWKSMQLMLPSIPLDRVPVGKDDSSNTEDRSWGDPSQLLGTSPPKKPKDHVALGETLDILDLPRAAKVSGARQYFLKGDGARLQQAVMRYTADHLHAKGFTLFCPPLMANYESFVGTGFFPGADENQMYVVGGNEDGKMVSDDLYLIGTSEVTVCSYHKDEMLSGEELPKKYAGHSACFRREAGTYGKDTKGLYRVHQFEKVEQVVLCKADEAEALKLFEEIRTNAEDILQALKLPYRVMNVSTGDSGKSKVFQQDIETWMPSRDSFGETHSCSYLGDFQARRLNIRYDDGGEKRFCHTLNNTCIASPRILIPILEMYQNADGSVTIPEVLRPYMNGQEVIALR